MSPAGFARPVTDLVPSDCSRPPKSAQISQHRPCQERRGGPPCKLQHVILYLFFLIINLCSLQKVRKRGGRGKVKKK